MNVTFLITIKGTLKMVEKKQKRTLKIKRKCEAEELRQKKIGFPAIIDISEKIPNEHYMIWSERFAQ